ncbi:MAG: AzlC family ABC transporter permease [Rhodospirillaceae bacterium]|nr:AzlC family ABC transporter permease [Rhodospirillaceae bacterium]
MKNTSTSAAVFEGVRHGLGLPTVIIFATMAGFGSLAVETGFTALEAALATVLVWAMPGQVAMAELRQAGTETTVLLLAVSIASVRFLPMATSLMTVIGSGCGRGVRGWGLRMVLAHLMSANTWPLGMRSAERYEPRQRAIYYLALCLVCITAGCLGTIAGYHAATQLPERLIRVLLFINPIFLSIMLVGAGERSVLISVVLGAALGPPMHLLSSDYGILLAGLGGGSGGYVITRIARRWRSS